ncbi:MAG TPA: aminodeoxychorismate/anthranilate synthase component II [Candidatus Methylomirabilis sp.]|jgi:anthranilate synthase/aminodeoxychorismate synthase-like glutamine amidotransferase
MIVLIDNYDSFTYNLVQLLAELGAEVTVVRNDRTTAAEVAGGRPAAVVISPGPCTPREAGISCELILECAGRIPVLGVCLGHQCIGAAFGGEIVRARRLMHGKVSAIRHDGRGLFAGLPNPFEATRYHSLAVRRDSLPACLEVSAEAEDGEIMGLRHRAHVVEGVQFHPESILTREGRGVVRNFLELARAVPAAAGIAAPGPQGGGAR